MTPIFLMALLILAQAGNAEQEIRKIEREWVESRARADAAYSENLLADDYVGTSPDGVVMTKAEIVAEVKAGLHRGMPANYADTKVRIEGEVAVSTGRVANVRYTRVYARRQGRWRLIAAQATPITRPGGGSAAAASARLPLKPCRVPGLAEEVLCGTREVYENREARQGRRIPLNVVVLPALSPKPAPDPLFALAGGPGQAATAGAAGDAQRFAEIRRERDIVLVDQRGTGKSNRLTCESADLNEVVQGVVGSGVPVDLLRRCRAQLEARADLRFYATATAMDDLDEVRAWLGYERINLYGGSYGTRAALVYLKQHPRRVRTLALRAVFQEKYPLYSSRDTEQALDRLFADCARDAACAKAFPSLRQDLEAVLRRLEETPGKLATPEPRTGRAAEFAVTRDVFAGALRLALYDADMQRYIPLGITRALKDDFSLLTPILGQALGLADAISMGMNLCVHCTENVPLIGPGEVAREVRGGLISAGMVQNLIDRCREWPRGELHAGFSEPVRSPVPALIFSGALDPVTPPAWGEAVARHLPQSLHVVMEGVAHAPFPKCAQDLLTRFVADGSVKGLDTSCVRELRRPPFVVPGG